MRFAHGFLLLGPLDRHLQMADQAGPLQNRNNRIERLRAVVTLRISRRTASVHHGLPAISYRAFTHLSEPASLTEICDKKTRAGLPSDVPGRSVEIRRGPAFL